MNPDNFKLVGIRPLEKCDKRFLKNLNIGTIYKFYNEYKFLNSEGKEIKDNLEDVISVNYSSKVPESLYQINNGGNIINVNISALVGKNGSGKSSILELLYASCYVIASRKKILKDLDYYVEKRKRNQGRWTDSDIRNLQEIQSIYDELNVELFYSINEKVFSILLNEFGIIHKLISGKDDRFLDFYYDKNDDNLDDNLKYVLNEAFFYTISINYSLYGLNSKYLGNWIKELFHKNDGYQTPLVINPFRNEGDINVNSELHLAQTRLLTNIINNESNNLVNGKLIDTVVFELDNNKYNERVDNDIDELYYKFKDEYGQDDLSFVTNVYNGLYRGNVQFSSDERRNFTYLCRYVFRKILKISQSYSEYKDLVLIDSKAKKVEFDNFFTFLSKLRDDRSHITLKLRQVLNNIRFNILYDDDEVSWVEGKGNLYYKIKLSKLIERLEIHNTGNHFLYEELIPIGCFNPVLWVENNKDNSSISNLDVLSSGEQHFIHSIQSILYHLININSVFETSTEKIKYSYVNIVLDEIELYYHPEFQRIFINELLLKIKGLSIPNIKGINILFCTHSPFILSDIPIENTLKLEVGKVKYDDKKHNTLGANIHDLLDNDFYLQYGFMGEYVKNKVFSLINFLDEEIKDKHKTNFSHKWNKISALNFIELIGEPVLKSTLKELYFGKFKDDLDAEIERLSNLRKMIN